MAGFVGTLLSPWGVVAVLLGFLVPLLLPVVPAVFGVGHSLARLHLWLGMKIHGRLAWVVDDADRLVPKRLHRHPETGDEHIRLDGETLSFEDPDLSLSKWMNVDMCLADGKYGVLFDPRHAALGGRIAELRDRDEAVVPAGSAVATEDYGIGQWVRGVVGFERGQYELPRLSWVRQVIGGRERATHPSTLEEFYRKSREPYEDDSGEWARLLAVIAAMILPAMAMWLVGDYISGGGAAPGPAGGGGDGGASGDNTTDLGLVLFSLAGVTALPWRDWAWQAGFILAKVLIVGCSVGILIAGHWLAVDSVGIAATLALDIAFVLGLLLFGALLAFGAVVGFVGGGVGSLLLRLGLVAYRRPVWVWRPDGYELVDYARLDVDERAGDPVWYRAFGADVGFSFAPEPTSWPEHIPVADIRAMSGSAGIDPDTISVDEIADAVSDGGSRGVVDQNLPVGCVGVPELRRGGGYAGYVPEDPDERRVWVRSGVALNRLWDAATGDKSLAALLAAKEEYGGDTGLGEGAWLLATAGLALVSFAAGGWLFVV